MNGEAEAVENQAGDFSMRSQMVSTLMYLMNGQSISKLAFY